MDIKNLRINLENKILESNKVIIVPHNNADMDAIGSAIGLYTLPKKFKKNSHIVLNDPPHLVEAGVKLIIKEACEDISIIDKDRYSKIYNPNDLFIITDTNKIGLVSINEYLNDPKKIFIIDHHEETKDTINSDYKYIDTNLSSASEIVSRLLLCSYRMKISKEVANYLLSGIYLDTNHLSKNTTANLFRIVSKLIDNGADVNKVDRFFTEDFTSDRKVQDLVSKLNIESISIATAIADDDVTYTKEELAKVADYALKYGVDASFAIGKVGDNTISISARSKGIIDVGKIMEELNGGGNKTSGATRITNESIGDTKKRLRKIISPKYYLSQE